MQTDSSVLADPHAEVRERRKFGKILIFMAVWVIAVGWAVSRIGTAPPELWKLPGYDERFGYTWSLALVYLPWLFLLYWYQTHKDQYLSTIGKAVFWNGLLLAGVWTALDIFLSNLIFRWPDVNAHIVGLRVPGYIWADQCQSLLTIWKPSCYQRTIPIEEILFYLGSAALLRMLYMWAAEEMFQLYSLPRDVYREEARSAPPLVQWNTRLLVTAVVLLLVGILLKRFGPHPYRDGLPYYLFAELVIVFVPLAALYNKVHKFTNPRAFLFVMVLQVLISVVWEATLALPYGWWNYRMTAMIGLVATPWSSLALEACFLWVSVAWGVMFMYEASKIKALTGRPWREVLWGPAAADLQSSVATVR